MNYNTEYYLEKQLKKRKAKTKKIIIVVCVLVSVFAAVLIFIISGAYRPLYLQNQLHYKYNSDFVYVDYDENKGYRFYPADNPNITFYANEVKVKSGGRMSLTPFDPIGYSICSDDFIPSLVNYKQELCDMKEIEVTHENTYETAEKIYNLQEDIINLASFYNQTYEHDAYKLKVHINIVYNQESYKYRFISHDKADIVDELEMILDEADKT